VEQARTEAASLVAEASSPSRTRKLVSVFDQLSDCLCRVADMSDFLRVAHPNPLYATAATDACANISSLVETLNTDTHIYGALKKVLENGDVLPMDDIDRRVAELFLFDFEQSGIHLPESDRRRFVALTEQILLLGSAFMQGTHKPVYVPRDALDSQVRDIFSTTGNNIRVTGLFADNPSDTVREAAYRIYLFPDGSQTERLESLLAARAELARLTGFKTYAHRALGGTMAGSPERVVEFLETLAKSVRSRTDAEIQLLREIKRRHGGSGEIYPWDTNYYGSVARHEVCRISGSQLAPYFSLGACIDGLSGIFSDIFGIQLQRIEALRGELWSADVQKLLVVHETEGELGVIYCDLFERPGKPHHDCHFTVRGGRLRDDGSYQQPVVVLLLNLPPPCGSSPSLLSLAAVENLFHEFGHAMHSMLGRTRYQHVTGTRCPTDFAEVPSVLLEYFARDARVLSRFARHWQTGKPVPRDDLERVLEAKKLFAASETQQQVFYSLVDQAYHGHYPVDAANTDIIAADIQRRFCSLAPVPRTSWQQRFGHFVGYGARYYSYLMSRAVAARVWHHCFRNDPFSRAAGERYRSALLAHGGQIPPAQLVHDVLGEQPTTDMLVRALLDDLDS
jgi:intermediate peptidase